MGAVKKLARWTTRCPDRDLANDYGLSRIAVRGALSDLFEAGLLVRRQGAGTS